MKRLVNNSMKCKCDVESLMKVGCKCGGYPEWPGDEAALEAWNKIAKLARENALIVQAAGGTMILALPRPQRENWIFLKCLYMSGFGPHPQNVTEEEI